VISLDRPCLLLVVLTMGLCSYARTASAESFENKDVTYMLDYLEYHWMTNAGMTSTTWETGEAWESGDANYDGAVDGLDLDLWNESFVMALAGGNSFRGSGVDGAPASRSAGLVPEPGTLAMLTAGLLAALAYAWRKRK
jgi:hypothetical protein